MTFDLLSLMFHVIVGHSTDTHGGNGHSLPETQLRGVDPFSSRVSSSLSKLRKITLLLVFIPRRFTTLAIEDAPKRHEACSLLDIGEVEGRAHSGYLSATTDTMSSSILAPSCRLSFLTTGSAPSTSRQDPAGVLEQQQELLLAHR